MTKKILYFVLLSVLIMSVGYDIQTGRIQFGSSRINDSTSALMTMNKGLLINGDLYTPDAGKFYIGDNYLNGLANNMGYYSTTHTFYTQDGTTIATFDSAGGVTIADNLTADTLKGNGTQITGAKSGYVFFQTLSNNYADGVTYYLGNIAVAPSTAGGNRKLYFNRACKIKGIALNASVLGTLGNS
ncbi:MAG: hypothetical protein IPJ45_17890 [Ignavibacteria bacterium]|nr:hypothetical protein [Ignavibacteria bacterium]